ncbi:MAG: hypothetical protein QNL17_07835 [Synechococcus sp. ChSW.bin.154]
MREIQFKGIMKVDKLFAEYSWLMLLKRIKLINIAQDLLKVIVMERLAQTPMKMRSFLVFFKCVLQLIPCVKAQTAACVLSLTPSL